MSSSLVGGIFLQIEANGGESAMEHECTSASPESWIANGLSLSFEEIEVSCISREGQRLVIGDNGFVPASSAGQEVRERRVVRLIVVERFGIDRPYRSEPGRRSVQLAC